MAFPEFLDDPPAFGLKAFVFHPDGFSQSQVKHQEIGPVSDFRGDLSLSLYGGDFDVPSPF